MSKWINKDLFNEFAKKKKEEVDEPTYSSNENEWKNPEKGTSDKPNIYKGRFLADPKNVFYKKYIYHMYQVAKTKYIYFICPKTYSPDAFCPMCSAVAKLFKGTKADLKDAYKYLRKIRFVANWYVVSDPRDMAIENVEKKSTGKVLLYNFPAKVESKLKSEIVNDDDGDEPGLGYSVFDPSEGGFNFILKVLATIPDKDNKKSWPDYSNSGFSRQATSLGTDDEIDVIMGKRHDLTDYIEKKTVDLDTIIGYCKKENIYDIIADEIEDSSDSSGDGDSTDSSTEKQPDKENVSDNGSGNINTDTKEKEPEDESPFHDDSDGDGDNMDILQELQDL